MIEIASQFGVAGFKLNGAGGEGGSLTLLLRKGSLEKHQLIHEIENANPAFRQIPVRLAARGLRRWKTEMAYDNPGLLTANTV